MSSDDTSGAAPSTLQERLRELFATIRHVDDRGRHRPYTTKFVADAISADPSHRTTLGRTYLDGLRNGRHTNPTGEVLRALVQFFNARKPTHVAPVTVGWLIGEEDRDDRQLHAALAESRVRNIAMRVGSMNDELQDQVLDMLDVLSRHQRTEPGDGTDHGDETSA